MVICASCKNKTSNDRCSSNALPGISLCGRHAKMKSPRLWNVVNNIDKNVTLISKFWKGYFTRKILKLAGPGVLNRSLCNNTDEIVSLEPVTTIDVFNYFSFKENDKIYCFDIRTILDIVNTSLNPINPYTRQAIVIDDRRRLRELHAYRIRNNLEITHNLTKTVQSAIINRWTQICQIVEENGFFNVNRDLFTDLNKTQLYILLTMINNDLKTWAAEHKPPHSKRFLYVFWTNNLLKKFSQLISPRDYSFFVSSILLSILYDTSEPYNVCFIIMSALYRL